MSDSSLIDTLLVLIAALPLAGALLTAALGRPLLGKQSHWPVVAGIGLSSAASLWLLLLVAGAASDANPGVPHDKAGSHDGYQRIVNLWTWASIPNAGSLATGVPAGPSADSADFVIDVTLRADPLTAIMLAMVTFLSFLVAVYSIGYMHGEEGYWRYFAYIGLFVFSMTMLVSASNFVLLYVFWEAVGASSYLLIGFWYHKPAAASAAKKAFLVNRIGDFGFALGMFLIWTAYGTLSFHDTAMAPGVLGTAPVVGGAVGTAICLLLFAGACGKSAQFPLHVWLPDAMEGPTPVSALIHAATMVTAGVYMVARCFPLFAASIDAQHVVALVGAFTAAMAAIVAVTQTDLKRILAYSTVSQLGFMFLGLGAASLAGATSGMFHLFTHGFFKALLFLGAGSVMHAMGGVIDIRRFGGLRRLMPVTHATFLVGCLALAGFPGLSGFWSKDAILLAVHDRGMGGEAADLYMALYWLAVATAFLTALYSFRAFFLTFWGKEQVPHEAHGHAHESPAVMTAPLVVLALFALAIGGVLEYTHAFADFLAKTPALASLGHEPAGYGSASHVAAEHASGHVQVMLTSSIAALAGIALAALFYLAPASGLLNATTRVMRAVGLYTLSTGKFFFDVLYSMLIVWPLERLARVCAWFDRRVIDGLVDVAGAVWVLVAAGARPVQGGMLQSYALAMVVGVLLLVAALLIG